MRATQTRGGWLAALVGVALIGWMGAGQAPGALVAYWNFDEGSGTTPQDFSANNNDGIFGGTSPTWSLSTGNPAASGGNTASLTDHALRFNGGTTYVQVPYSASLGSVTNQFTIAAWVYEHSNTNYGHILVTSDNGGNRNWLWQTDSSGGGDQNYIWSTTVGAWQKPLGFTNPNGVWNHYAFTYDGTLGSNQLTKYINGVASGTLSVTGSPNWPNFSPGNLYIGGWLAGNSSYNGRIDDMIIFNSLESATSIMNGTHPAMLPVAIPAPAAVPAGLALLGIAGLRRRR